MSGYPDSYFSTLGWRRAIPSDEDTEVDHTNQESFLLSPQTLWVEPPVEETLTVMGNASDFYFYGTGVTSMGQDLSAELAADVELFKQSPTKPSAPVEDLGQRIFSCSDDCTSCRRSSSDDNMLYEALPSPDHIRLLELLPGSGPLECKLHVAVLPHDQNTYEAVSYTWDLNYYEWIADTDEISVWCNGTEVPVKENLHAALCTLRRPAQSRVLWVDSLCICQNDNEERGHQVARMGSIFESASQVLVWLGTIDAEPRPPANPPRWWNNNMADPSVSSTLAQEALSGVCQLVNEWRANSGKSDAVAEATFSTSGEKKMPKTFPGSLMANSPIWKKIFHLYRGRWFQRLWIIQEVAVARSLTVLWDDCEISWETIGIAAAIIRNNFQRISSNIRKAHLDRYSAEPPDRRVPTGVLNAYFMYRLSRAQKFSEAPQFTFLQLVRLTRHFGCKDQRDRIYGLLALPTVDGAQKSITPDYSMSTAEVYEQLCRTIIASSKPLSILSSVYRASGVPYHCISDELGWAVKTDPNTKDVYIPSWVPQWQYVQCPSLSPPESHPNFNAALGRPAELQRVQDIRKLVVRGIFVDDVKGQIPLGSTWRGEPSASAALRGQGRGYGLRRQHLPLEQILETQRLTIDNLYDIATTLTTGKDWFGLPVTDQSAHLADYTRCLLKEGLRWSFNPKYTQKFSGFDNQSTAKVYSEPSPQSKFIEVDTLHELSEGGNADRFLDSVATGCSERVAFETQLGMVGMGPRITQAGDKVCVLYVVDLPFILRREGDVGYSVVGACYIQPLMKGEAVQELSRSGSSLEESWIELV